MYFTCKIVESYPTMDDIRVRLRLTKYFQRRGYLYSYYKFYCYFSALKMRWKLMVF
jgi:hypothetical protein